MFAFLRIERPTIATLRPTSTPTSIACCTRWTFEANDEISCGHGEMIKLRRRYYERWKRYMMLPKLAREVIARAVPLIAPKKGDILRRAADDGEYFWNYEIAWWESEKNQILSPDALAIATGESPGRVVERDVDTLADGEVAAVVLSSQLSLDSRCPYTNHEYAHFVFNIPAELKAKGSLVKYFFKRAIEGLLPNEIIYRPKQGFRTPVVELFQNRLGQWAEPILLEGGLTKAGFLRKDTVAKLLNEHRAGTIDWSNRLWTVMVLNLWHERWTGVGKAKLEPEHVQLTPSAEQRTAS